MAGYLKRELAVAPLMKELAMRGLFNRKSAEHEWAGRKPQILIRLLTFQPDAGDGFGAPKFLLGDDQIAGKAAKNRCGALKSVMQVPACLLGGNRLLFAVQMLTSRDIAG